MSEFLGTELDDETVEKVAKHCTFDNLKNVKSFDLSVRIKSMNNAIPFKIMRVSYCSKIKFLADVTNISSFSIQMSKQLQEKLVDLWSLVKLVAGKIN